jgi:hypothetical protein
MIDKAFATAHSRRWLTRSIIFWVFALVSVTAGTQTVPPNMPTFADYPARVSAPAVPAPVDLSSLDGARRYRTRLREGAAEGPNFAGAFRFVSWGCGTECQSSMVVSSKTGRVFRAPTSQCGYAFRKESRLLFVNPTPGECPSKAKVEAYEFTGTGWRPVTLPRDPYYARPEEYGIRWWHLTIEEPAP